MKGTATFLAGEGLQPVETATTLRKRAGRVKTMDGPLAETREHLGGFYLIEAADLDAALRFAAEIPAARYGSVEERPVRSRSRPPSPPCTPPTPVPTGRRSPRFTAACARSNRPRLSRSIMPSHWPRPGISSRLSRRCRR